MLKTLHIQNFQAHADTRIEFSPNVTAIIGLNNHGKSAIIRSIQKVLRNEPEGAVFIRDYTNECVISIETDRGIVERVVKSDGSSDANAYTVNGVEFVKFSKTGIPEEVLDVLGCSSVQSFGDVEFDLNFSNQLDPLFLMVGQGLPSIRGKVLGKMTGMDSIQRAIQMASADGKSLSQSLKEVSNRLRGIDLELDKYATLSETRAQFESLSETFYTYSKIDSDILVLTDLLFNIRKCISDAKAQKSLLSVLETSFSDSLRELEEIQVTLGLCGALQEVCDEVAVLEVRSDLVVPSLGDLERVNEELVALTMLMGNLDASSHLISLLDNRLELLDYEFSFEELDNVISDELVTLELHNNVVDVTSAIGTLTDNVVMLDTDLFKAETELHEYQDKLGVCPLCERSY
jgi:hypothetical protein